MYRTQCEQSLSIHCQFVKTAAVFTRHIVNDCYHYCTSAIIKRSVNFLLAPTVQKYEKCICNQLSYFEKMKVRTIFALKPETGHRGSTMINAM